MSCFFQLLITLSPHKLALLDLSPQAVVLAEDAESPSSTGWAAPSNSSTGQHGSLCSIGLGCRPCAGLLVRRMLRQLPFLLCILIKH